MNDAEKTPNTKLRTPKKCQAQNPNWQPGVADLKLGIGGFSGVWSLVFGVSPYRLSPIAYTPRTTDHLLPTHD